MKRRVKSQPRFAVVRRGYDIASVEAFIALEKQKAEESGARQRERIKALTAECEAAKKEAGSLRAREEQIKTTLMSATEQAEALVLDAKFRCALELTRLQTFRAKWTAAYEEMKERYKFGGDALNMESVALSVKLELEKFLAEDFSLMRDGPKTETEAEFRAEADRLGTAESKAEELRRKLTEAAAKKTDGRTLPEKTAVPVPEPRGAGIRAESAGDELTPEESIARICDRLGLSAQAAGGGGA